MPYINYSMVTNFTTATPDYDLLTDTNVLAKIQEKFNYGSSYIINNGIQAKVTVFVDSATQIKINNSSYYEDFLFDTVYEYSGNNSIKSLKIKDIGISGQIQLNIGGGI